MLRITPFIFRLCSQAVITCSLFQLLRICSVRRTWDDKSSQVPYTTIHNYRKCNMRFPQTAMSLIEGVLSRFLFPESRAEIKTIRNDCLVAPFCQLGLVLQIIQGIPPCHLPFVGTDDTCFAISQFKHV